jgi:uncharacterized protein
MSSPTLLLDKKADIAAVCRRYQVRELSLFGSALRPDFRPDSDIDLLVEFNPGVSVGLLQFGGLQVELESILKRKVDLVSKRGLRPLVRESILRQIEPLYAG